MEGCQGVGCGRGQARWHRKVWAGDEADGEVEGGGRVEGGPPETPRNRAWPFNTFLSLLNQNGVHARNCSKLLETYVLPPGLLWPKTESWPELVLYGSKTTDLPLTFRNLIKTHKITQISQNTTKALKIRQTPAKATNSHLTPKRHPKAVWGPPEFRAVSSSFEQFRAVSRMELNTPHFTRFGQKKALARPVAWPSGFKFGRICRHRVRGHPGVSSRFRAVSSNTGRVGQGTLFTCF